MTRLRPGDRLRTADGGGFELVGEWIGSQGYSLGCGDLGDALEGGFVCLPVFGGGLADCDFAFFVFAGLD